ncbi:mucus binding protein precursor Mub [Lactobacillus amylovorus GRL1118]|nr:mucus binding protein precursor Mub [Lactobacillus amylovorus GRL1118]
MGAVNGQNVKADTKSNNSEPTPVTEGNLEENAAFTDDTVQAEAETTDVDEDSDDSDMDNEDYDDDSKAQSTLPNGESINAKGQVLNSAGQVIGYIDKNGQVHYYSLPQNGEDQNDLAAILGAGAVAISMIGLAGVKKRRNN